MSTAIRQPVDGCFGSGKRTVERVTGHPKTDSILADQMLAMTDQLAAEALGREAAESLGRGTAEHFPSGVFLPRLTIALAAERAGHAADSTFADELWEIYEEKAWPQRAAELAEGKLQQAMASITRLRKRDCCVVALKDRLRDLVEDDLGRFSDADLGDAIPRLVDHAGIVGIEVESLILDLRKAGEEGRSDRDNERRRAHNFAVAEQARLEAERKNGDPPFLTYVINTNTWLAVQDEEFEAAEVTRAEGELVDRAIQSVEGRAVYLQNHDASLGAVLLDIFVAAFQSQSLQIPVDEMVERCARAYGYFEGVDLVPIVHKVVDKARACRSGAEAERAFMKLLATEGIAAPSAPTAPSPAVVAEPLPASAAPLSKAAAREAEMDALTHVPGLVGELVDWITATSMKPNRTLAFAASLVLVGTLAGRLYETETSLRTNIYALGLAPSGFGKDHARSCLNILVEEARCGAWVGGSKIASGTAMRRRVEDHPAIMWVIDEFGGAMKQMGDVRNVHNSQIRDLLLEYFESASDVFRGADYAGEQGKPCHNPNVSLYGLSNPDSFWQACQGLSSADGLLARFLAFSVGSVMPTNVRPSMKKSDPPASLIAALRELTRSRTGGNVSGLLDGSRPVKALLVPFAEGAEDAYFTAKEAFDKAPFSKKGRPEESIYARVVENGLKIALIIAIGIDADAPEITVERFQHGLAVAEHCAETTLREIRGRLADNDRQREHVDVKRMIVEAGWAGIGRKSLLQRLNGRFNERRLDEILNSLMRGSQEIVEIMRATKGRPAARFVAVENLGHAGEC